MLTPIDIQNKEFKSEFRGYSKQEVDEFLNLIIESYERLFKENIEARDKIKMLSDSLDQYKNTGEALQSALLAAQTVAEDIKRKAAAEGKAVTDDAHAEAERIIREANAAKEKKLSEYKIVKDNIDLLKEKFINVSQSQTVMLNKAKQTTCMIDELLQIIDKVGSRELSEYVRENSPEMQITPAPIAKVAPPPVNMISQAQVDISQFDPHDDSELLNDIKNISKLPEQDEVIKIKITENDEQDDMGINSEIRKMRVRTGPSEVYELDALINDFKNKKIDRNINA